MLTQTEDGLLTALDRDGIVVLPGLFAAEQIQRMRQAFESRLRHLRFSDVEGYEETERYRHMVRDVLTLDQGFLHAALHPLVKATLREYLGTKYELVEAKGWMSLPTTRDFHGWHGDAWYDQKQIRGSIPREVKLAIYLSDVRSGFFEYVRGSHRQVPPRLFQDHEAEQVDAARIVQMKGPAGTAFLFDTSGMHRQHVPILERRYAVFLNYHDPDVPLQEEDLNYYRYHPLLLNSAFLGNLDQEDRRILGFGNQRNWKHAFVRQPRHPRFLRSVVRIHDLLLYWEEFSSRVRARLRSLAGK